ncbi:nitroreductase family protein [Pseudoalteromonas carrageenovora]|uniref:nitroreductase family protein n=1 Tax=Pseudoalteromonas carrageenovora TaxID=227 RepID=UPI0026E141D0|nr:nitroreductase family protein [Pseudoalteromonas carrageenovora]MDO6548922.1 nitroreductase family protein [Pseudoalteromonas carrageenovora]MDO6833427.1 nitroreductase family protein [Pseudoalteromonas carrageenovora]
MRSLIKKLLPNSLVLFIYNFKTNFDFKLINFFSKSGFLASLYYLVFSREFDREHRAVLIGRATYKNSLKQQQGSVALLRRNTHRLEKGLIMKPRKPTFAEAYIEETVNCFVDCTNSKCAGEDELKWASDVLTLYFSSVKETKKISSARKAFSVIKPSMEDKGEKFIPYKQNERPVLSTSYNDLLDLFKRRRSVRWFDKQPVSEELVNKAVNAATLAPSACNRQPYSFLVIRDSDKATSVAEYAMGTAGFAKNIPCLIAVVGDLSAYPAERDRHVIYIDASLASMQLMLAFETLGLSTCPINWPDVEEREKLISKELNLAYQERVVMLMAVGYPELEGGVAFSQKKTNDLLIKDL